MSVFKVKLNNVRQGLLDRDPATMQVAGRGLGEQINPSLQRQVYVMGPNLINRLLSDGEVFTDCNYWKRFAYPNVPLEEAFIEVVTDDGSVYSDMSGESTFPRVWDVTAVGGTTFATEDNIVDIAGESGGHAVFVQITNKNTAGSGEDVKIRLNGLTNATLDLAAGDTQIFNAGDLSVSHIAIDNSASGAGDVDVQIVASVRSVCRS